MRLRQRHHERTTHGRGRSRTRSGSSYFEVQVALVIFSFGVSGLIPLSVVNSRQLQAVREQLPDDQNNYLNPPTDRWSSKLGAAAGLAASPAATPTPMVDLIDDTDLGFHMVNFGNADWYVLSSLLAYGGQMQVNYPDQQNDYAYWNFTDVPAKKYEVFVSWANYNFLTPRADFEVLDGWTSLGSTRFDQRLPPSGPTYQGRQWESLGQYVITSGVLNVRIVEESVGDMDEDGYIAADAVWIVPIENTLSLNQVTRFPSTSSMTAVVSVTSP